MAKTVRIGAFFDGTGNLMKKIFIISIFIFGVLSFANEQVIYTIEGEKDSRLNAWYRVYYLSTSISEECTKSNPSTATRKPVIDGKSYEVKDGNYSIDIPIYLKEDENSCGYQFRSIDLMMGRKYDKDGYSMHTILDNTQKSEPNYKGDRGNGIKLSQKHHKIVDKQ